MYVTRLLLVWGLLPAALLGGLACVAVAAVLLASNDADLVGVVLVGVAAFLLLYNLVFNSRGHTARTLSGTLPCYNFFSADQTPRSLDELNKAIIKLRDIKPLVKASRVYPSVVGSGWGFFTRRRGAVGSKIFMHRLNGKPDEDPVKGEIRFLAGCTILQCVRTMLKTKWLKIMHTDNISYPATFYSHPTLSKISIGSWFGASNHGNNSMLGKPSSHAVAEQGLQIWNMADDNPRSTPSFLSYEEARKNFDGKEYARSHLIVAVTFARANLAPNIMVQKKLIVVKDEASAEEWLVQSASYLRVLFMGSARKVGLGLSWCTLYDKNAKRGLFCWFPCWRVKHNDEHDCGLSRLTRVTQVDVCSAVGGCYEGNGNGNWNGISTLSDANLWSPLNISPIAPLTVALVGLLNFEIIFRIPDTGMTPRLLWKLVEELTLMHRKDRKWPFYRLGRTEIRYSGLSNNGVVFLDCALLSNDLEMPFKILRKVTDNTLKRVALHSGKYTGADVKKAAKESDLKLVQPSDIYYQSSDLESSVESGLKITLGSLNS